MTRSPYAIHWFRRDLRIVGNPALKRSLNTFQGRVLGVFCFDRAFLSRSDFSHTRFAFFLETLSALREDLREQGGDLLFLDIGPHDAFPKLLEQIRDEGFDLPSSISFNRDYEPFALTRDVQMSELFESRFGLEVYTDRDHLLIEPNELTKEPARKSETPGFYQVFTPFSKKWISLMESSDIQERIKHQKHALKDSTAAGGGVRFRMKWKDIGIKSNQSTDLLDKYLAESKKRISIKLPLAGHKAAVAKVLSFKSKALTQYEKGRDIPSLNGTSQISIYLKNGSITVPQVIALLGLNKTPKKGSSQYKYLSELIWREFYYHILAHYPSVEKGAFNRKYRSISWQNDEKLFRAWCEGRTGYPIVDAGMRQMNETGWMHNRLRMIVASFLCKDLLINWQEGERYFMEKLLDGDLAPNNGGWQWAASTGCDPQPFFRIFNPTSQSMKFDPKGEYIRRWVPELAHLSAKEIHEPHAKGSPENLKYPAPIVKHSERRLMALKMYRGQQKT